MALTDWLPTGDRILLEKIERPKTELIIRVAPQQKQGNVEARVVALGPLVPPNCGIKVGATVSLPDHCGAHPEIDGVVYWQVSWQRNDDILVKA